MKFGRGICGSQRMNPHEFHNLIMNLFAFLNDNTVNLRFRILALSLCADWACVYSHMT